MMTNAQRWGMGSAGLALGLWLVAGLGSGQAQIGKDPLVPDADYPKLVEQQIKVLQDTLKLLKDAKDPAEKKKMAEKARCTSVLVAAIAQDNLAGKDGGQRATLRDAALDIAALVKANNLDEAAKKTAALKDVKADGKAKTDKIKLFDVHIDLQEWMSQFKLPKAGGQGTEAQLLKLGSDKKKTIPPTSLNDQLLLMAYQSGMAAELAAEYKPSKDVKDWLAYSTDMRKSSAELADKIKAKDGKGAFAALNKLNTSCSVCHDKFRK
jgi:hypothetical protein